MRSRRVTTADIASEAGVSRTAVGYVLNNTPGQTISAATRRRVLEAADRLGYQPNHAARSLASGRSRIVLLVLPDLPDGYTVSAGRHEAESVLGDAGYNLVTCTRHPDQRSRPLWELLVPDLVMGLVPFSDADIASMRRSGVQHVFPDPQHGGGELSLHSTAPAAQVDHLAALGHRRIAVATSDDERVGILSRDRAESARARIRELELTDPLTGAADTPENADRLVAACVQAGVTGVVGYNDEVAATVIRAAICRGLRVPDDLSVVGHDDSLLSRLFVPSISSLRINTAELGRWLADLALGVLEGRPTAIGELDIFEGIVHRESTAAAPGTV
ncbi:LacI family DNA-binding transcriptional regulator [Prescottella agglutinans]|uniref:DNA-binding LacI/PurR family transcriptional regulator n=1 Tax=Prescottella agglutinans TaxID=1644129 RepID=A0ABT6M9F7_9NOCA|nr:LacI family DNA-binding transcriptional regulator [Prescottella agglutinans]MDH6280946.1 DNA-binding LacI/PurR family transcriptional regulator [Prescottella agglutinans]